MVIPTAIGRGLGGMILGVIISAAITIGILFLAINYWKVIAISVLGIVGLAMLFAFGFALFLLILAVLHFFGFFYYFFREKDYGDNSINYSMDQTSGREDKQSGEEKES